MYPSLADIIWNTIFDIINIIFLFNALGTLIMSSTFSKSWYNNNVNGHDDLDTCFLWDITT